MPSYEKDVEHYQVVRVKVICDRCGGNGEVKDMWSARGWSTCPKCGGQKILGYRDEKRVLGGTRTTRTEY